MGLHGRGKQRKTHYRHARRFDARLDDRAAASELAYGLGLVPTDDLTILEGEDESCQLQES
jgi:hypothetical protein